METQQIDRAGLEVVLESIPEAMLLVEPSGQIGFVNRFGADLFGYPPQELQGLSVEALMPMPLRAEHVHYRAEFLAQGRARGMCGGREVSARHKDGHGLTVEIRLGVMQMAQGSWVICSIRDATARRRDEAEHAALERALAAAIEANQVKNSFIANMSHELRTPLNAIIGFGGLLYDGEVGPLMPEQREFLGDILFSAKHLLHIIGDLLEVAQAERGKLKLHPEPVDIGQLIDEVKEMLGHSAERKHIAIEREVAAELLELQADPRRLRQILFNFISNAVKFTPDGGRVVVRVLPQGESAFRLEVEDTGIGIRREDVGKLFVEFQQLDSGVSKRYQGMGLGLALTKQLVEAQGGEVGARSELGKGSVFFAVMPRLIAPHKAQTPEPGAAIQAAAKRASRRNSGR